MLSITKKEFTFFACGLMAGSVLMYTILRFGLIYQYILKNGSFFGAIIGSLLTGLVLIGAVYLEKKIDAKREYVQHLQYMNRELVQYINNLVNIKKDLLKFYKSILEEVVPDIRSHTPNEYFHYSVSFVLFYKDPLNTKIKDLSTKSNYLDTFMIKVYGDSANFSKFIDNTKDRFENIIKRNDRICELIQCQPERQKELFADLLEQHSEKAIEAIESNIQIILKDFIMSQKGIEELCNIGIKKWNKRFGKEFPYRKEVRQNIEDFILERSKDKLDEMGIPNENRKSGIIRDQD